MRKILLALAVVGLAVAAADAAVAQRPCDPYCESVSMDADVAEAAGIAPVLLATIAFLLAPRSSPTRESR